MILGRRPDGYNEVLEDHTATPPPWWSAFREIIKEYQYYVHKPPRASKSRRRQRYQDRVARLSRKGGGVKKRRRLGPPGTSAPNPTVINDPAHKSLTNSALTNAILRFCIQTMCLYYRLLLVYTTGIAFINFVVMHCHLGDDYVAATSLAFAASLGALMGATAGIAAFVAFLWTVPVFAAILVNVPAGAEHFLFRLQNSRYPDPPPTINTSSQTDGWSKRQEDLLAYCEENKLPMIFGWGPFGHASRPSMVNSAVYDFPWREIVKNEAYPVFGAIFFVSFMLFGAMVILNLFIGVIMNSMDESHSEMNIQKEINRRKDNPEPIRDGIDDLHKQLESLSQEMRVIKKMLENQQS